MESQLRQAQDEIKKLQTRLAAFEAAKAKEEEEQAHVDDDGDTDKMKTLTSLSNINADSTAHVSEVVNTSAAVLEEEKTDIQRPVLDGDAKDKNGSAAVEIEEIINSGQEETDVFEVPLTPLLGSSPESVNKQEGERSEEKFPVPEKEDVPMMLIELRARLVEKEDEVQKLVAESQVLKKQAEEKEADARREEEEAAARVRAEMEEMRKKVGETEEALAEERSARAAMEEEMKRMRVQTEQWRKAADAAAEVLAEGGGSMDSRNLFGYAVGGMGRYARQGLSPPSPPDIELEGGGKKKGGGGGSVVVRGLGDLWKKKHHHHHK